MSLLQAYLQNPKTRRILSRKPGEKGFSLIELVVVVAVLAILAAIAIPAFTSITLKARASAATNTIATVVKECATKYADAQASPTFAAVTLDGYTSFLSNDGTNTSATACVKGSGTTYTATSADTGEVPTFVYNVQTGTKTCSWGTASDSATDAAKVGCKNWASATQTGVW